MQGKLVPLVCLVVFGFAQHGAAALIGYWPLDEGSGDGVFDRTGNGHNGTIEGATWASPGWDGKGVCLDFDGAGHLVRIADAQTLRFSSEAAYALTAWVHVNSLPGRWVGVVTKGRDTAHWYGIWIEGGNRWVFGHQPNNLHGSPVTAGLWTHVAVVYDNGLKRLYLNGVLDAEVSASGSGDSASDLVFGAALGVTEFAPVRLNEIRLYDHALNADEVVVSMQRLLPPELARDPVPENEAVDVPREIVLRWAPGAYGATRDVYFGVVFEDVNEASRADPRGVLVSQGQTATTYSLSGWLDFETTYYWRIDEVNAAPSGAIFEGKVWSFTTEPLAYPVANVIATTNGDSDEDAGPENTVDGSGLDDQDRHTTSSTDMWLAEAPEDEPLYIQYEFDRVYKLHQMLVWNYNVQFELALGIGLKDVTVEYSVDGEEWILLSNVEFAQATARSAYTANTTVPFDGVPARYVRLTVNSNWGGRMNQFGLSEVRFLFVPAHAREPQPADGAADVSVNTTLAWRAGRNAVSHEVYFGTDAEALDLAATVEATSYDPGALNLGATYYWQVNAVQEAESWTGDLWSFATQQYLVVDDFESYTDDIDAGEAIFDTWLDGWVNDTGSTVGHIESPFAERTIVRSGRQSMPLFYDNTTAAVSEAELELAADWTTNGIRSLSLYFYGAAGNTGQLYVKINNTKVPYDGEAADLKRPTWQPWNIDLSAVGNVSNVQSLTIGIEGVGATGVVYIDDVRLYPHAPEFIVPAEPDARALVAYYALDGDAADSSGNGYHGTEIDERAPTGAAPGTDGLTYVAGIDGQGLQLDGLYEYVDFGIPAGWPAGTAPRSMAAWAKTNTVDPGWRWIAAYGTGATSQAMFIGLNGMNLVGGGHGDDIVIAGFWTVDEWHHISLTYDGTTARLYADGVQAGAAAKNWNLVPGRAHIGRQVSDTIEFWSGVIDEVRLYDRDLSAEEIAWLAGRTVPLHRPF